MKLKDILVVLGLLTLTGYQTFGGTGLVSENFRLDDEEDDPLKPKAKPPKIFIGPIAGIVMVQPTGSIQPSVEDPTGQCDPFESGKGSGFYAGLSAEYILGDPANSKSSIIARLYYQTLPSGWEYQGSTLPTMPTSGTVVNTTVNFKDDINYNLAALDLFYRFTIGNTPFGVVAGPTVGMVLTKTEDQTLNLIEPESARFEPLPNYTYQNNNRTVVLKSGDIEGAGSLRIGLKAGLQYEFIMKKISIVPIVMYNFGITSVVSSDQSKWQIHALEAGVDIRFAL